VSDLADVLELLHHQPRVKSLRGKGRAVYFPSDEPFVIPDPPPNTTSIVVVCAEDVGADRPPEHEPEATEEIWRIWISPPDGMRAEFGVGTGTVSVVFRGDAWWSWSPSQGALTNGGRGSRHGKGPAEPLLYPSRILPAVELEVLGMTEALSRPAYRVRAVPVMADEDDIGRQFALGELGYRGDEYELLVDAEAGFLLRAETPRGGAPSSVLEFTEIAVDEDLPADTFTLQTPPGEEFEEPAQPVTLDDLPSRVPFKVFVPAQVPAGHSHIGAVIRDRRRGGPLVATVEYLSMDDEFWELTLEESSEPLEHPPGEPAGVWGNVEGLSVTEDESVGSPLRKVRLVLEGTHVQLESSTMPTDELIALARTLVVLPSGPPRLTRP
jgi:outer membrane lipoprotein-sorting protein